MPKSNGVKLLVALAVVVIGGAAYIGYSKQSEELSEPALEAAAIAPASPSDPIFGAQPGDIVIGKADAPVTIVDYSSLTCPHCAYFHIKVLAGIKADYIDSGKAKLVYRHFPLNAPALRAAQLVDCADENQREKFLQVLFDMQGQWATSADYEAQLKQIASVGGIDSARYDACIADAQAEERILLTRKNGAEQAKVEGTPALFINGVKLNTAPEIEPLREALDNAAK